MLEVSAGGHPVDISINLGRVKSSRVGSSQGEAGRLRIREQFDWRGAGRQLEVLYFDMVIELRGSTGETLWHERTRNLF